jgi:hypothetical protein
VAQLRHSDLARFCDALRRVVQLSRVSDVRNIMVVGFGSEREIAALRYLFPYAQILAIDTDSRAISKLQKYSALEKCDNLTIAEIDARALTQDLVREVDLTIIRHPDLESRKSGWATALPHIVSLIRDLSVLFVTTYSLSELEFVLAVIDDAHAKLIPGAPYSTKTVALNGSDRRIAAFLKVKLTSQSEAHEELSR